MRLNTLLTPAGTRFTRSRLAASACAVIIGAGVFLAPAAAGVKSSAEEAFRAYSEWFEGIGFQISNDPIRYDASTDQLSVPNSQMTLNGSFSLPPDIARYYIDGDALEYGGPVGASYSLTISSRECIYTGFARDGNRYSANRISCPNGQTYSARISLDGVGEIEHEIAQHGISIENQSTVLPKIQSSPGAPSSQWLPTLNAFLSHSYEFATIEKQVTTSRVFAQKDAGPAETKTSKLASNDIRITDVVDGRIGRMEIKSSSQTVEKRVNSRGDVLTRTNTQGETVLTDFNIPALFALLDPSIPETGEKITFIGSHTIKDHKTSMDLELLMGLDFKLVGNSYPGRIHLEEEHPVKNLPVELSMAKQNLTGVTVIKRDFDFANLVDQIFSGDIGYRQQLPLAGLQLARSFGIESGSISGMSASIPTLDGIGDGIWTSFDLDAEKVDFSGIDSNGIDSLRYTGVDFKKLPHGGHMRFGSLSYGGIRFADFQPMAALLPALLAEGAAGKPDPMAITRAFMPRSMSIAVKDLDLDVPGKTQISIANSEHTISTVAAPLPTSIYSKTDKAVLPLEALNNEQAAAFLKSLGFENVTWSNETRLDWDESTLELTLEKLMIDVEGLGTAEATMRFGNVPKALFEDPENQGQMALVSASFIGADISFADAGGTNKTIAQMATQSGISETDFIKVLVAQTEAGLVAVNHPEFAKSVTDAVADFLTNPGTLRITLQPQNPVPVAQIVGSVVTPQVLPDLLNAQVRASN